MGQFWPSALLLVVSRIPNHLVVLGTGWRGVFCGLLQHLAALWQDWSKTPILSLLIHNTATPYHFQFKVESLFTTSKSNLRSVLALTVKWAYYCQHCNNLGTQCRLVDRVSWGRAPGVDHEDPSHVMLMYLKCSRSNYNNKSNLSKLYPLNVFIFKI